MRAKRYKLRRNGKLIIFLALLALILTYLAYPHFYSAFNIDLNSYEIMEIASHEREGDFSDDFVVYNGGLLHLQGANLELFDRKGDLLWRKEMNLGNAFLCSLPDSIIIVDINKGIIYGIDNNGKSIWEYRTSGKIQRAGVDNDYIWVKSLCEDKNLIEIVSREGENTGYLSAGSSEIVEASVSADGEHVAVSTLEIQGKDIVSNLGYYNKNGTILWAHKYNDNVILGIKITEDEDILVLNEKRLINFNNEGNIQWYHQLEGYVDKALLLSKGMSLITLSEDYRSGIPGITEEQTLFFDRKGVKRGTYHLDGKTTGLTEGEDYLAVFTSRQINLIDYEGKEKAHMKLDKDVNRVFLFGDKSLAYVSGGDIYFSTVE